MGILRRLNTSWRAAVRDRGYALTVVLTIAFGIAANTAVFSVVNSVLLRPLAYRDPGRLVIASEIIPELSHLYPRIPVNARHYTEWRDRLKSFDQIAILDGRDFILTRSGEPERLHGARASSNLFSMLGITPQFGRVFTAGEDKPGQDHVAIITDSLWERRFHRDRGVVGKSIVLDTEPYSVIGVLPRGFHLPKSGEGSLVPLPREAEVFKPIALRESDLDWFGQFNFLVIGRLKPGVSEAQARAEMNVLQAAIATHFPEKMHLKVWLTTLEEEVVGASRKPLSILLGAVGAVLLIICVNLANLSLARSNSRRRDLAIRTALGASRAQIARQALVESLTLSLAGGVLGVALAYAALKIIVSQAPIDLPRLDEVGLDGRVLWFAFALSAMTGLLFGMIPAWRSTAADPQEALRSNTRSSTETKGGLRIREVLVGFEVGLSAVLLIVAGLLIASFSRLMNVDKGFNSDHLIAVQVGLSPTTYKTDEDRDRYYRQLTEKVRQIPGVKSSAIISHLPLQGETWVDIMMREGDTRPATEQPIINVRFASADYFRTMRIPVIRGRAFEETDRNHQVVVVSERAAERAWPGENPIGKRFRRAPDNPLLEVIGVVKDVRVNLSKDPVLTVYIPYWQRSVDDMNVVLRAAGDPRAAAAFVRSAVWSIDPDTVIGKIQTMDDVASSTVAQRRFQMLLIAGFAAAALVLACIGIYGVISWSVTRRRNEIGIRMALGAQAGHVRRMVLVEGMRPVLLGLAMAVGVALAFGQVLNALLFGVTSRDPLTLAAVVCVLAGVAAAACLIPAFRSTRYEPVEALRYE
jgi:putative ABC transport system permease protein